MTFLQIIGQSPANHFVILFRDAGMQYKGLYTYNVEKEEVFKIHGVGPKQLTQKMFDSFFKYALLSLYSIIPLTQ